MKLLETLLTFIVALAAAAAFSLFLLFMSNMNGAAPATTGADRNGRRGSRLYRDSERHLRHLRSLSDASIITEVRSMKQYLKEIACFAAVTTIALVTGVFLVLGTGKIGSSVFEAFCIACIYAAVHAGAQHDNPEHGGAMDANPLFPPVPKTSFDPCARWSQIWLLYFMLRAGLASVVEIDRDMSTEGTAWRPLTLGAAFAQSILHMTLVGTVLFQAHLERGYFYYWYHMIYIAIALMEFRFSSPYPMIGTFGSLLYIAMISVGTAVISLRLDAGKDRRLCKNRCAPNHKSVRAAPLTYFLSRCRSNVLCAAVSTVGLCYFALSVAGSDLPVLIKSSVLTVFGPMVYSVMCPCSERAYGDDAVSRPWSFNLPAHVIALDLGQSILFLETGFDIRRCMPLLALQEVNSILRNTGRYARWYEKLRELIDQPLSPERQIIQRRRLAVIAPCGALELVSPVIILVVLMAEALFNMTSLEVAPSFATSGVLKVWRSGNKTAEIMLLLVLVLAIRAIFIVLETKLHFVKQERKVAPDDDDSGVNDNVQSDNPFVEEARALYDRIALTGPPLLRRMGTTAFFLNVVVFVPYASRFGRQLAHNRESEE